MPPEEYVREMFDEIGDLTNGSPVGLDPKIDNAFNHVFRAVDFRPLALLLDDSNSATIHPGMLWKWRV